MSGLNKYSLLNSREAGPFTNQNRIINYTINAGGVYDLSQCFIQLVTRCITDSSQVHNMCLRNLDGGITPKNVELIRSCRMSGSKCGPLEDITRVNVLQSNLLELTKSTSEKMCMVNSIYQVADYQNGVLLSPWVEWHKDGSSPSIYRDNYLRIPLSQLFSLGSNMIDTSKTGDLNIRIELEDLAYVSFEAVPLFRVPTLKNEGDMQTVTTVTSTITTVPWNPLTSVGVEYDSVESSPYFVGQKLNLEWAVDGSPGGQDDVTVMGITYNVVAKTISLLLDFTFPASTDPYETIVATEVPAPADFAVLSIANANLGVCEIVGGPMMKGDVLQYMTWSVEQYSNNANSLEKIFEVESNAVNAILMFNDNVSSLLSVQGRVNDYRMRIDNSDVYDRNIHVNFHDAEQEVLCHDPLHYDAINRTFLNAAIPLKNLTCLNMCRSNGVTTSVTLDERFNKRDNALMMLCTPLPLTASTKKLQYSVSTKTGMDRINNVILFKQIVKSVRLP